MKRVIFSIISVICFVSCSINNSEKSKIEKRIFIKDSSREIISGLTDPKVDITLLKDDEDYLDLSNQSLDEIDGTYTINLDLVCGSSFKFSAFTLKDGEEIIYILDEESTVNDAGFTISIDGVFDTTPKVELVKVTELIFDALDYDSYSVDISTDETSQLVTPDLVFKVSSNITDAAFNIYKYSIYWVDSGTLNQNEVFDMDTGAKFNPLDKGDGDPWGTGKFKIETTNSLGEIIFIIGDSSEWSKKHIHLTLN